MCPPTSFMRSSSHRHCHSTSRRCCFNPRRARRASGGRRPRRGTPYRRACRRPRPRAGAGGGAGILGGWPEVPARGSEGLSPRRGRDLRRPRRRVCPRRPPGALCERTLLLGATVARVARVAVAAPSLDALAEHVRPRRGLGVRRFRRRHLAWSTTRRRAGAEAEEIPSRTGQHGRGQLPAPRGVIGGRGGSGVARALAIGSTARCPRFDRPLTARLAPALWRGAPRARAVTSDLRNPRPRARRRPRQRRPIARENRGCRGPPELLPRGGAAARAARGCGRARAPAKIVGPIEPRARRVGDPRGADPRAHVRQTSRVSRLGARV